MLTRLGINRDSSFVFKHVRQSSTVDLTLFLELQLAIARVAGAHFRSEFHVSVVHLKLVRALKYLGVVDVH